MAVLSVGRWSGPAGNPSGVGRGLVRAEGDGSTVEYARQGLYCKQRHSSGTTSRVMRPDQGRQGDMYLDCQGHPRLLQCMLLAAAGQNLAARAENSQPRWHTTHILLRHLLAQTLLCLALRPAGALPMHLHRALQAINGQKSAASAARPSLLAPLMLLCRSEAAHGNQVC